MTAAAAPGREGGGGAPWCSGLFLARQPGCSLPVARTHSLTHIQAHTHTCTRFLALCLVRLCLFSNLDFVGCALLSFPLAPLARAPAGHPVHACCSPNQRHPVPSSRPPGARGLKVTSFLVPPASRTAATLLHLEPRSDSRRLLPQIGVRAG